MVVHVVGHAAWRARELAAAGVPVRSSLGWEVPALQPGDSVWAPMEWMARADRALRCAGRPSWQLADAGPRWLAALPAEVAGRTVVACTLGEAAAGAGLTAGWWKPANCKVETLPARWSTREDFLTAAYAAGLPDESQLLVSEQLDVLEEHRVFVLDGVPVTSSPYLWHHVPNQAARAGQLGPVGWDQVPDLLTPVRAAADGPAFVAAAEQAGWSRLTTADVLEETASLLRVLARDRPEEVPPVSVVDVALTSDGRVVVLEANPVWSSAWYGADLEDVAACLAAAVQTHPTGAGVLGRWGWEPDPWLVGRADRQRLLEVPTGA